MGAFLKRPTVKFVPNRCGCAFMSCIIGVVRIEAMSLLLALFSDLLFLANTEPHERALPLSVHKYLVMITSSFLR